MSKELAAMKRDRSLLEEKVQLNEFKAAKRNKKNKAKIAEVVARIGEENDRSSRRTVR